MADELLAQVLEETRQTRAEVSGLRADLARIDGRVTSDLAHGADRMKDIEDDVKAVAGRVTVLERATWKAVGAAAALGTATGGAAGALLSWLLAGHP